LTKIDKTLGITELDPQQALDRTNRINLIEASITKKHQKKVSIGSRSQQLSPILNNLRINAH
jgi:hypothetical protein